MTSDTEVDLVTIPWNYVQLCCSCGAKKSRKSLSQEYIREWDFDKGKTLLELRKRMSGHIYDSSVHANVPENERGLLEVLYALLL